MSIVHHSVALSRNTKIAETVLIGPHCSIGFPGFQFRQQLECEVVTTIGENTIIMGNSVICLGSTVGRDCRLDYHSYVGEQSVLGDYCVVEYGARIYDGVVIGEGTTISGFICNHSSIGERSIVQGILIHKFKNAGLDEQEPAPIIGDDCFVGRGALIIGGITIAGGSYVSAGSVVTRSTSPNKLYAGNPATELGDAPKSDVDGVSRFNIKQMRRIREAIDSYTWT